MIASGMDLFARNRYNVLEYFVPSVPPNRYVSLFCASVAQIASRGGFFLLNTGLDGMEFQIIRFQWRHNG